MLLERCPALCMNYIHSIQTPEDFTPEKIAEFASNYEYRYRAIKKKKNYFLFDSILKFTAICTKKGILDTVLEI